MKLTKPVLVVLLLWALAGNINAQEVAEQKPILADAGNSMTTDYGIKAADVVTLYILRMPELSREYIVSARGTIDVPFLGEIDVLKKTAREVAAKIADGLRGGFLVDPQVIATVKATLVTHRYFIQGSVRAPGVYNFEARPSLLELISVAGGLEPTYGATAFIMHKIQQPQIDAPPNEQSGPQAEYELRQANISALLRGEFAQNLKIDPNDIVQIPAADVFFVAGSVNAPGSFALKESTTLRQAISLAQGTTPTASPSNGIIFREDLNGQKREIPVDVGDIMKGKNPDITILANDIIVIPSSQAKSILIPVVSAFGTTAVYAATNKAILR